MLLASIHPVAAARFRVDYTAGCYTITTRVDLGLDFHDEARFRHAQVMVYSFRDLELLARAVHLPLVRATQLLPPPMRCRAIERWLTGFNFSKSSPQRTDQFLEFLAVPLQVQIDTSRPFSRRWDDEVVEA